jgi:hypothetical protein
MSTLQRSYTYSHLPQDDTFRYLILQPGAENEPLVCSLHTAQIAESEYYAISYVWGTDIRDREILCDGYAVKITPNLSEVLRHVRLPDRPLALWADSICINQEDKIEKGHQVALMGKVYRSAKVVLLYIGSDNDGHGPAICSLLDEVDEMIQSTCRKIDMTWDSFPYPDKDDVLLDDPRWDSLYQLLSQDWFRRGWVVQEAALAAQGEVLWGQSSFDWQKLMRTYSWLSTRGVRIYHTKRFREVAITMHSAVYQEAHKNFERVFSSESAWLPSSILHMLNSAKKLDLKDPRDRIYAFMDLPQHDTHRITIRPDYFAPYLQQYRQFAVTYIQTTRSTELLDYVCHDESTSFDCPSWVPRWDVLTSSLSQEFFSSPLQPRTPSTFEPVVTEDCVLKVRGVIIDTVQYVSEIFNWESTTVDMIRRIWDCINTAPVKSPYNVIDSGSSLVDAFFHALAAGTCTGEMFEWLQARNSFALEAQIKQAHIDSYSVSEDYDDANIFINYLKYFTQNRRFILTDRGYMGLAPILVQEGDACSIIFGSKMPCILRKAARNQHYTYLGATALMSKEYTDMEEYGLFFDDILGEEVSKDWVEWDVEEQDIYLC